jgi:hypothetical protein
MWQKFELYILSLFILFLIVIVITIPVCFTGDCSFIGWHDLTHKYIIVLISLIFMVLGVLSFIRFNYKIVKGATILPVKVLHVENINYESVTFIATYIIPLACIDLEKARTPAVFFIILFFVGWIYIKTNLFYTNPTLAIWGYHIYRINTKDYKNIIIINRGKIQIGESIFLKKIDDNIYFSKQ